jgi:hypothetical protein
MAHKKEENENYKIFGRKKKKKQKKKQSQNYKPGC